jgi:membrane-bound serine protease (ClpP class)
MSMTRLRPGRWVALLCLVLGLGGIALHATESADDDLVHVLRVDGAIGPATSAYVRQGIDAAEAAGAELLLLEMDTPGGLDQAMRDIIRAILESSVPVATYVTPSGARAASAGTYILYASHVAAMAPATTLGAATPVQVGGMPGSPGGDSPDPPEPETSDNTTDRGGDNATDGAGATGDAMSKKMVNDAAAYIRGLAELRGRNAEWAEKAVREAASLTAQEARAQSVIDQVASDRGELIESLQGRTVEVATGSRTLAIETPRIVEKAPDWRLKLLAQLTNPNVAYILFLIGLYGIIFEFSNPGFGVPGVIGAMSLLTAMFAFQMLPINQLGLLFMLLGLAFMVAEAFVPSFGILGVGGVVAFVFGSVMLIDAPVESYEISIPLIVSIALFSAAFFVLVIGAAVRARRRPSVTGRQELLNSRGVALEAFDHEGWIRLHSESWRARSTAPVAEGQTVVVDRMDGLTLEVHPVEDPRPRGSR